jgi:hypothetical protein
MLQAGRSPVRVPDEVEFFNLSNPSSCTMALGSNQPLIEMSTRNLPGGKNGRRLGLTTLPLSMSRMSENVGASTSRNPKGLHSLYRDNLLLPLPIQGVVTNIQKIILSGINSELELARGPNQ